MTFAAMMLLCAIVGALTGVATFVFCDMYVYKGRR